MRMLIAGKILFKIKSEFEVTFFHINITVQT